MASAEASVENEVPLKKTALSDRREFVVFRDLMNEVSKPDSYRARSRHDRFFCFSFFRENKEKGVVDIT